MKRAIVLSGGGAKGAYELGCWRAFRRLGINFDIAVGTSVGALNSVMIAQNDYRKAYKLWNYMDYNKVVNTEIKAKYQTKAGKKEIIKMYTKGALKGGLSMEGLEGVIKKAFNADKLYKSKIDFGLVTAYFPSLKGKYVTKENTKKEEMASYLLATSSCFPALKMTKIGNNTFIDGGYYDNLPINLAINMGAEDVIAIDMGAIGIIKKVSNNKIPIKIIKPKNDLGNLLIFEKEYTRKAMSYGFNDVMKEYGKLDGNKYTFKKDSLKRNYKRISDRYFKLYDAYSNSALKRFIRLKEEDKYNLLFDTLESLLEVFKIDDAEVYRTSYVNVLIKKEVLKSKIKSFGMIKKAKLNKKSINKDLIIYIYNKINKNNEKDIKKLRIMFPKAFRCALYIKTIMKGR